MSPRKNMKKAEEQHPPAPFAEDDTASQGDDAFEGLSQDFIEEYWAAYDALDNLNLNDDENENGNEDSSEDSQSTPDGYEQEQSGETRGQIQYLRSNGNEPPLQHRVNYRTILHLQRSIFEMLRTLLLWPAQMCRKLSLCGTPLRAFPKRLNDMIKIIEGIVDWRFLFTANPSNNVT
ncbi:uncharacterized protein J4E79_004186 [Alternaria viburni]|uniref:uncharacterized protein n=1 Tax=Alternaria viburni TaxID=566460 RepID=UPI0020C31C0F|nr:uncharacterized protein J4E79_004186 [Alternaria viburni]KAI4662875.1 hypothetical protein J4E79_004186 [Alternaria viburni]